MGEGEGMTSGCVTNLSRGPPGEESSEFFRAAAGHRNGLTEVVEDESVSLAISSYFGDPVHIDQIGTMTSEKKGIGRQTFFDSLQGASKQCCFHGAAADLPDFDIVINRFNEQEIVELHFDVFFSVF